ncbi:hypothetical protein OCK02_02150 [Rhizobium sp. TRM96647]|uniref:hypothetical protein n=1 Tax=unclassified Rhizobium TaxID=2613769 RepID=UPI0021E7F034|nr:MULTISPECIES: hypothetical protein [unclassified Rhizobium]MCV3734991.1 hypothetical protein [Rhizobium sp. TRM96647]MCV3757361.1 hypothetical protein [Rhizobium sp. TRM96650]
MTNLPHNTQISPVQGEASPQVQTAAMWLADQAEPPRLAVPVLKERFGLSALEACQAIAIAERFRTLRRAFG